jgi:hypothetical protein
MKTMRTEKQIRDAIDILTQAHDAPCDCASRGKDEAVGCWLSKMCMAANVLALEWAIGSGRAAEFQEMLDGLRFSQQQPGGAN